MTRHVHVRKGEAALISRQTAARLRAELKLIDETAESPRMVRTSDLKLKPRTCLNCKKEYHEDKPFRDGYRWYCSDRCRDETIGDEPVYQV